MKELRGRNSSNNLKKLKKKRSANIRTNFQSGLRWSTTQRLTPKADRSELPEWDQSKQLNTVVNICLGNGYRPRSLVCLLVFTTTDCFTISGLVLRISSLMNIICVCVCGCVGGKCGWRGTRSLTHFRVGPIPSLLWGILMGRSHSTQPYLIVAKIHSWVKAWHSETLTVTAPQREDDCSSKQNKQNHWGRAGRVTKKLEVGGGEGRNCTITKQYHF